MIVGDCGVSGLSPSSSRSCGTPSGSRGGAVCDYLSDLSELTVLIDLRLVLRVGPFLGRPFLAYLLTCASRCDTITQTPKGDYCA
jgi:hypothetical protein